MQGSTPPWPATLMLDTSWSLHSSQTMHRDIQLCVVDTEREGGGGDYQFYSKLWGVGEGVNPGRRFALNVSFKQHSSEL